MASIKGFQMKNVKRTLGIEGYGCTATMYLNGNKIGTYADYGDGGCEYVSYVSKEAEQNMMKVIIAYAKENPNDFIINLYKERPHQYKEKCERFKELYPYISDEDITIQTMASSSIVHIVEDFLNLLETEKIFKKYQKKGYRAVSVNRNNFCAYPASWSDEKIKKEAKENKLYMSLDDFII